jgi:L-fuculose-phosphate aldolase
VTPSVPVGSERRSRLALVAAGARLASAGLILPGEGNLSVRLDDRCCLLTPGGADKGRLRAIDLLRVPLDNNTDPPVGSSSEARIHRTLYRARPDVAAVVHAHPPAVLALAVGDRLPDWQLLLESELLLGPVGRVDPLPPGSDALAVGVAACLAEYGACVMHRHGAVTVGDTLAQAVWRMLLLERLAGLTAATS